MTMILRLLLIFVAATAPSAAAQEVEEAVRRFDEGNMLYRDGDYAGALERYRAAVESGYASGALYYNMGNAFYRMDALGEAIRHYEKARRLVPERPELAHSLAVAREHTVDSFSRVPELFWRPAWTRLVELLSPVGLFLVGLLGYLAACAALARRIQRGPSDWMRRVALAGSVAAVVFVTLGFAASAEQARRTQAVVLVDEVALLDRADGSRTELRVHEGTIIEVVTVRGLWSEVRLPNGTRGWMRSESYGTI